MKYPCLIESSERRSHSGSNSRHHHLGPQKCLGSNQQSNWSPNNPPPHAIGPLFDGGAAHCKQRQPRHHRPQAFMVSILAWRSSRKGGNGGIRAALQWMQPVPFVVAVEVPLQAPIMSTIQALLKCSCRSPFQASFMRYSSIIAGVGFRGCKRYSNTIASASFNL